MQRWLAILLVLILLLNTVGFYGVLHILRYQNEKDLIADLDASRYNEELTELIRIPLVVPYASGQTEFQRVDGKFYHEGNHYRLVKQRLSQDTLYVVCIKDHSANVFDKAISDYVKTFTDDGPEGRPDGKTSFSFIKDYVFQSFSYQATSEGWSMKIDFSQFMVMMWSSFSASILHPPQLG